MLVSKLKNCLPFLLYPFTCDILEANILSYGSPIFPPSSIRVILFDGSVLKIFFRNKMKSKSLLKFTKILNYHIY
jgi:hypothetical protein